MIKKKFWNMIKKKVLKNDKKKFSQMTATKVHLTHRESEVSGRVGQPRIQKFLHVELSRIQDSSHHSSNNACRLKY